MVKHTEIAIETLAEVKKEIPWTNAEKALLQNCHLSMVLRLGGEPPKKGDKDKQIRADLIRFLLMGGDKKHRPAPTGICVKGAEITGELNLEACTSDLGLYLHDCFFSAPLMLSRAKLAHLDMSGSTLQGADLHRLNLTTDLSLRKVQNTGAINLSGAKIGGQFACRGAEFKNPKENALNCNGAAIGETVFLDKGFTATGMVDFIGAKIDGQFTCTGAKLENPDGDALNCNGATIGGNILLDKGFTATGAVNFVAAKLGGQFACRGTKLENPDGSALNCNGAEIDHDVLLDEGFTATGKVNFGSAEIGGLFSLRGGSITGVMDCNLCRFHGEVVFSEAEIKGGLVLDSVQVERALDLRVFNTAPQKIDLTNARIHTLKDDDSSWKGTAVNLLNGFSYEVLDSTLSVDARLEWLEKNKEDSTDDFNPQPYLQLAKTLREMGKRAAATRIMIEREKRQIKTERQEARHALDWTWRRGGAYVKHALLRRFLFFLFSLTFGYGHAPFRGLVTTLILMLLATFLYWKIDSNGNMVPNHTVILTSPEWREAVSKACGDDYEKCKKEYADCKKDTCRSPVPFWRDNLVVKDYETFSAIGYGIDIVFPLVPIGQETAWSPSLERGWLAKVGFYARWVFQIMGWILAAMAAGALTGIIGRRD